MANSKCLQSLCLYLNEFRKGNNGQILCFRGQASTKWELQPSLQRQGNDFFKKDYKSNYSKIFRKFPDEFSTQETTLENVVKIQHYEIPTSLLDVTFNPLVATFFALDEQPKREPGCVYFFAVPKEKRKYISEIAKDDNGIYLIEPPLDNPRIKAQNGAFFCNLKDGKIDNEAEFAIPSEWKQMKIEIPNRAKEEIREELFAMNISYESLFPELGMVSKNLKLFCQN